MNNIIDNSLNIQNETHASPQDNSKAEAIKAVKTNKEKKSDTDKLVSNKDNDKEAKGSYNMLVPKKNDLNTDAPIVPLHYQNIFNINNNTLQKEIGNSDFLKFNGISHSNENNSYINISPPAHVNL